MKTENPNDAAMSNLNPNDKIYRCFNGELEEAVFVTYVANAYGNGRQMSCKRNVLPKPPSPVRLQRFTCSIDMYFSTPEKAIEAFLDGYDGYVEQFNRYIVKTMQEHVRVLTTFDNARARLEQLQQERMQKAAEALPALSEIT